MIYSYCMFCKNIMKRSQGKQERNVGGELKKDSTICVRVRENGYKMIANSYSNTG